MTSKYTIATTLVLLLMLMQMAGRTFWKDNVAVSEAILALTIVAILFVAYLFWHERKPKT